MEKSKNKYTAGCLALVTIGTLFSNQKIRKIRKEIRGQVA
jgi:hypothetical protein